MDNYDLRGTSALNSGIHNRSATGTLWAKEILSDQKSILNTSYSVTGQTTFYAKPSMENGTDYYYEKMGNGAAYFNENIENGIAYYSEGEKSTLSHEDILSISMIVIGFFGILGNGIVIWLLGCRIKKNYFTTYILNLAIADFSFVTDIILLTISDFFPQMSSESFELLFSFLHYSLFITSQLLLTVISVERCVSVLFPLWHHCHRSTNLSTILCALIWVISFLPTAISEILIVTELWTDNPLLRYQFLVNGIICLPLMTISSLLLFIKVCCKSRQRRRKKILTTILITVFFFWFFCIPYNALTLIIYISENVENILTDYVFICATLNSSINPLIYYLVGRSKKGRSNKSMKAALQELFKEAEIESHLPENPAATTV